MSEKERQQAIKDGTLAEYYQKQVAEENKSLDNRIGRIKLLEKEKRELLDDKYDLMQKVGKINLQINKINTKIEELKKWHLK